MSRCPATELFRYRDAMSFDTPKIAFGATRDLLGTRQPCRERHRYRDHFQHPAILWFLAPIKMVRRTFFRFPKARLIALAAAILSGVVELLIHHIDATQYYKRPKAPSAYTFDKFNPIS